MIRLRSGWLWFWWRCTYICVINFNYTPENRSKFKETLKTTAHSTTACDWTRFPWLIKSLSDHKERIIGACLCTLVCLLKTYPQGYSVFNEALLACGGKACCGLDDVFGRSQFASSERENQPQSWFTAEEIWRFPWLSASADIIKPTATARQVREINTGPRKHC